MAMTPEPKPEIPVDFRAPPPSPVASGRRSSVANNEVLSDFLENSLKVPDLILPDRVFPRQKSIQNPPRLDFQLLNSSHKDSIVGVLDSIAQIGCFELVNHGIPRDLIRSVLVAAGAGIFQLPSDKKALVARTLERPYGFEESHGDEERETSEEFVWSRDEDLKSKMEGIWPRGYSNFSKQVERILVEIEKIAEAILVALKQISYQREPTLENGRHDQQELGSGNSICFLYKHCGNKAGDDDDDDDESANSLRYDVIRMLIRGSEFSHSLCLYPCGNGSSEFHVYSKKGWVSFCPDKEAIVVTIGDQLQAWSGGQYRHVVGRPIFQGQKECISVAFLYSPPNTKNSAQGNKEKTISLSHQVVLAILLTLLYHLFVYIFN